VSKEYSQIELLKAFKGHPIHWLAMGFGTGLFPKAPGTFGTLAALPFIVLTASQTQWVQWVIFLLIFISGIWICQKSADALGAHDHGSIVWDEIAGYYLVMLFVPITALSLLLGFILFRIFDILKPWPIKYLDKHIHGGLGIMLDDILAGIFAGGLLYGIQHFFGIL